MPDGKYFTLEGIKEFCSIALDDESDDETLIRYGRGADSQVDNDLSEFQPIPVGDDSITRDLIEAANSWAARRYDILKHDFESSKEHKEIYNDIIDGIKSRLKSRPTTHTTRATFVKPYLTEPMKSDPVFD